MWKNILILVFLGPSLFVSPSFSQESTGNVDTRFIRTWEARAGSVRTVVTVKKDGTFVSEGSCPYMKTPETMTGSWEAKDNKIIWTYDKDNLLFRAGEKDINPILEVTKEKFVLKETNGLITIFKKNK